MPTNPELVEVRERLYLMRSEVEDRLARARKDRRRATAPTEAESVRRLESDGESELRILDHALRRIESGLYPTCSDCGERIEIERLREVPYAMTCWSCARRRRQAA